MPILQKIIRFCAPRASRKRGGLGFCAPRIATDISRTRSYLCPRLRGGFGLLLIIETLAKVKHQSFLKGESLKIITIAYCLTSARSLLVTGHWPLVTVKGIAVPGCLFIKKE